jgi:hypothetical protein
MHRLYPSDIFETLWDKLTSLINDGVLISCEEVLDELSIGGDALSDWAEGRRHIFEPSEQEVQKLVREILTTHPGLVTSSNNQTIGADPFLIAHAKIKGITLVSEEKIGTNGAIKIPNVCESYGVRAIKFFELLRELKIKV